MSQPPPTVLSFAASDSTGGAGIQADILTLASMGCHPLSVITAITIQDTAGVDDVMALDPEWVADQARAVLEDMPVNVFKIGMLGSVEIIASIAEVISDYPNIPLVLDPVLASGRGDELANDEMVMAMRELLLPQATIITPNSLEARRLAQDDDDDDDDDNPNLSQCAGRLLQPGLRVRPDYRNPRKHFAGYQQSVRKRWGGTLGQVAAVDGIVPWVWLHPRIRHCCWPGERAVDRRGCL